MQVKAEEIENALMHAKEVTAHHAELPVAYGGKKTPDSLLYICREYIKKQVRILVIDGLKPRHVKAHYEALEDGSYNVYVLGDQDPLWRDFGACKELFHVVLDDPSTANCRTIQLWDHVEDVVTTFLPLDGQPAVTTTIEFLAEMAAMEFLFPYTDRVKIIAAGQVDCAIVANQYGLPIALVERYLADSYMQPLKDIHEQLG